MRKYYVIMADEYTFYSTDIKCRNGFIHLYGGLKTRFTCKEFCNLITIDFNDVTNISTPNRETFNAALSTFGYTLDDNDNIVPERKTETFVSFKSLDQIAWEIQGGEESYISRLYGRLYGIALEQYEKLRREFGERRKDGCKFNESETFLVFDSYHIAVECLNFEEREV
jgi:hypothetical protein